MVLPMLRPMLHLSHAPRRQVTHKQWQQIYEVQDMCSESGGPDTRNSVEGSWSHPSPSESTSSPRPHLTLASMIDCLKTCSLQTSRAHVYVSPPRRHRELMPLQGFIIHHPYPKKNSFASVFEVW
jgi:hypothetical protein